MEDILGKGSGYGEVREDRGGGRRIFYFVLYLSIFKIIYNGN